MKNPKIWVFSPFLKYNQNIFRERPGFAGSLPTSRVTQTLRNVTRGADPAESQPVFHCRNCRTNVNLMGMGLNGSFIFSPQISSVETGPEPPSLGPAVCGRNHGLDKITETQKKFIFIRYGGTCKSKIFISGTEYMSLCIELFFVKYKVHVFSVIFDFWRTRYKYIVFAKKHGFEVQKYTFFRDFVAQKATVQLKRHCFTAVIE